MPSYLTHLFSKYSKMPHYGKQSYSCFHHFLSDWKSWKNWSLGQAHGAQGEKSAQGPRRFWTARFRFRSKKLTDGLIS